MLSPDLPLSEALCSIDYSTMPAPAGRLHGSCSHEAGCDLHLSCFTLRAVTGDGYGSLAGTRYLLRNPVLSLLSSPKLRVIQRRKAARLLCKPVGILGDKNLSLVPKPLFQLYWVFYFLENWTLFSLCQLTKVQPGSGQLRPPFQAQDPIQRSAKPEDRFPLSPVFSGSGPEERTLVGLGASCSLLARARGAHGRRGGAPSPRAALGSALLCRQGVLGPSTRVVLPSFYKKRC